MAAASDITIGRLRNDGPAYCASVLKYGAAAYMTLQVERASFFRAGAPGPAKMHAVVLDEASLEVVDAVDAAVLAEATRYGSPLRAAIPRECRAVDLTMCFKESIKSRGPSFSSSMSLHLKGWEEYAADVPPPSSASPARMRESAPSSHYVTWAPRPAHVGLALSDTKFVRETGTVGIRSTVDEPCGKRWMGPQDVGRNSLTIIAVPRVYVVSAMGRTSFGVTWTARTVHICGDGVRASFAHIVEALWDLKLSSLPSSVDAPKKAEGPRNIMAVGPYVECCILLEPLAWGADVAQCVTCHNIAGRSAVETWFAAHRTCPYCRSAAGFDMGVLCPAAEESESVDGALEPSAPSAVEPSAPPATTMEPPATVEPFAHAIEPFEPPAPPPKDIEGACAGAGTNA